SIDGEEAAVTISRRMAAVPMALRQVEQTLREAAAHGHIAARHQMEAVAEQCDIWVDPAGDDFWPGLAQRVVTANGLTGGRADDLGRHAEAARDATVAFARFLRGDMAPIAPENQAFGREKYALASRAFLGATIDLDETYAWAFGELHRIEEEMRAV